MNLIVIHLWIKYENESALFIKYLLFFLNFLLIYLKNQNENENRIQEETSQSETNFAGSLSETLLDEIVVFNFD